MSIREHCASRRGAALVWVSLTSTLFILIISSLTVIIIEEMRQSNQISDSSIAYMAAEAGYERAMNYAKNDTETLDTSGVRASKTGQINANAGSSAGEYEFQVVEASAGDGTAYDDPVRYCDNDADNNGIKDLDIDYCFYAIGRSGSSVRKLDGTVKDVSADQSRVVDFSGSDDISHDNQVGWLDMEPADSSSRDFIVYIGQLNDLNNINNEREYYLLGLYDRSSPLIGGERRGLGMMVFRSADNLSTYMQLSEVAISNDVNSWFSNMLPDSPPVCGGTMHTFWPQGNSKYTIDITGNNAVTFTLTYRRGAVDRCDHTVTLQVNRKTNDQENGRCIGLRTATYGYNLFDAGNIDAYFAYGGTSGTDKAPFEDGDQLRMPGRLIIGDPGDEDEIGVGDLLLQSY